MSSDVASPAASISEDEAQSQLLIERIARAPGECAHCGTRVSGHEYLLGYVLGFADEPRCFEHLAAQVQQPRGSLLEALTGHIARRECLRRAWVWAGAEAGLSEPELWSPPSLLAASAHATDTAFVAPRSQPPASAGGADVLTLAETWDAGTLSCGDLVLELRMRLRALQAGHVIEVHSRDIAAPEDIPAWCRLTGHTLVYQNHPVYRIQRKQE